MEAQRKIHLLLIIDYVLGLISTLIAFLLTKTPITWPILFLIPLIILIAEVSFKIHQVIYRHIDFVDIWRVALAVAIGHGILGSLFYRNFGMRFIVTSLAIYLCALCGSRIIFKIWFYSKSQVKQEQKEKKLRTIIVGAGSAGTMVKAQIEKTRIEIQAEAEAETIRRKAKGTADAVFLKMQAEANGLKEILSKQSEGFERLIQSANGDPNAAMRLLMTDKVESLLQTQVEAIKNINIDKITVWDSMSGEGGASTTSQFLNSIMRSLPPMKDVYNMVGIDMPMQDKKNLSLDKKE